MYSSVFVKNCCLLLLRASQLLAQLLDPFRNLEHDKKEARDHVLSFDENFDDYKFQIIKMEKFPLKSLSVYDDYRAWLDILPGELVGLDRDALFAELRRFRGAAWAEKAMKWLESDGIPAIVLVQTPEFSGVADGRGRVTLALGMGMKTIPAVIMKANKLPHQS